MILGRLSTQNHRDRASSDEEGRAARRLALVYAKMQKGVGGRRPSNGACFRIGRCETLAAHIEQRRVGDCDLTERTMFVVRGCAVMRPIVRGSARRKRADDALIAMGRNETRRSRWRQELGQQRKCG